MPQSSRILRGHLGWNRHHRPHRCTFKWGRAATSRDATLYGAPLPSGPVGLPGPCLGLRASAPPSSSVGDLPKVEVAGLPADAGPFGDVDVTTPAGGGSKAVGGAGPLSPSAARAQGWAAGLSGRRWVAARPPLSSARGTDGVLLLVRSARAVPRGGARGASPGLLFPMGGRGALQVGGWRRGAC